MEVPISIGIGSFVAGFITSKFVSGSDIIVISDVNDDEHVVVGPPTNRSPVTQDVVGKPIVEIVPYKDELIGFSKGTLKKSLKNNKCRSGGYMSTLSIIIESRRKRINGED